MSQYNFRNIREIANAPLEKEVSDIAKIVAAQRAKQQLDLLDDKEDKFPSGVDDDVGIKFRDELNGVDKILYLGDPYYVTFEPDHDKVTLMLPGKSLGVALRDYSGFQNHAFIFGEPILKDGAPFDPGVYTHGTKSVCMRFNRPTSPMVNQEYMSVPDSVKLQVTGVTTGLCFEIRLRMWDLNNQGGLSRRIFEKIDDNTPNNAYQMRIDSSGRIIFMVKKAGTWVKKQTGTGVIVTGRPYTIWITYDPSSGAVVVYLRDEQTGTETTPSLTDTTAGENLGTLTNHDLKIFSNGANGFVYGDYYDMRIYRTKLVSAAEVDNHFTNCFTIYDRAKGELMITNHWTVVEVLSLFTSYTPGSYTPGSYSV